MKDILKVGDKIQYSFEEDYEGMDIIETLNKNDKIQYYGRYLENNAHSEECNSLDELLDYYKETFDNVKILSKDGSVIEIKNFKEDIDYIKSKGFIIFEKDISEKIHIEILKLKVDKDKVRFSFHDYKYYYLEYLDGKLYSYSRLSNIG